MLLAITASFSGVRSGSLLRTSSLIAKLSLAALIISLPNILSSILIKLSIFLLSSACTASGVAVSIFNFNTFLNLILPATRTAPLALFLFVVTGSPMVVDCLTLFSLLETVLPLKPV